MTMDVDVPGFILLELIDPEDDPLSGLDLALIFERGVGDLLLCPSGLDSLDHPAAALDIFDKGARLILDLRRERLDVVRARERIDYFGDAAFVRDHLLGAERELHRLLGWQRERLVVCSSVERLRTAQDRGERVERDADNIVLWLLRGELARGGAGARAQRPTGGLGGAKPVAADARR